MPHVFCHFRFFSNINFDHSEDSSSLIWFKLTISQRKWAGESVHLYLACVCENTCRSLFLSILQIQYSNIIVVMNFVSIFCLEKKCFHIHIYISFSMILYNF